MASSCLIVSHGDLAQSDLIERCRFAIEQRQDGDQTHIWVVSKGINCDLCQRLRMLDILKQLIAQTSILLSALSEGADPSPIGMVFGKQESLQ
jgi:hypothetical protein